MKIARSDYGLKIASYIEIALDMAFERIASCHKILQNPVDGVLVEDLHVAERIDIELERFQLYAAAVGHVTNVDSGEIGEIGERADGREFR
jgi:hypothetical protein